MNKKRIEKLLKEGKLKKFEVSFEQIERLLRAGMNDLVEAEKVKDISPKAIYILSYMAMLKAGRSLLLIEGYIPSDGSQHKTVVEMTGNILGENFNAMTTKFEIMRRKRNDLTYEADILLSMSEAQKALIDAKILIDNTIKYVKTKNPQLQFNY